MRQRTEHDYITRIKRFMDTTLARPFDPVGDINPRRPDAEVDDTRRVLRLHRLRANAEAAGNTVRVAQLDWCMSWMIYKHY